MVTQIPSLDDPESARPKRSVWVAEAERSRCRIRVDSLDPATLDEAVREAAATKPLLPRVWVAEAERSPRRIRIDSLDPETLIEVTRGA
jgi:hypothetical protein